MLTIHFTSYFHLFPTPSLSGDLCCLFHFVLCGRVSSRPVWPGTFDVAQAYHEILVLLSQPYKAVITVVTIGSSWVFEWIAWVPRKEATEAAVVRKEGGWAQAGLFSPPNSRCWGSGYLLCGVLQHKARKANHSWAIQVAGAKSPQERAFLQAPVKGPRPAVWSPRGATLNAKSQLSLLDLACNLSYFGG